MSWKKTKIFGKLMKFFSTLFNLKKSLMLVDLVFNETHLQSPDFVEDDIYTERTKDNIYVYIMSICQIIYYILHARKKKTPFHMMTAHAIYDKCKSRVLTTTFDHIGVCINYRQVQKAKTD